MNGDNASVREEETPINPYQPSASGMFGPGDSISPADLITRPLRFSGIITDQHHSDAVTRAGIRIDYLRFSRVMSIGVICFLFIGAAVVIAAQHVDTLRLMLSMTVLIGGITAFCIHQRWLLGGRLPSYQLLRGGTQARVDREGIWVQADGIEAFSPLSHLVATATTYDLWVLTFGKEIAFWYAFPFSDFSDPAEARLIGGSIEQIKPPVKSEAGDRRKLAPADWPSRFTRPADAIPFHGEFQSRSAARLRMMHAAKTVARRSWMVILFFLLCVLASLFLLTGFNPVVLLTATLWLAFFFALIWLRIWKAGQRQDSSGRVVLWWSEGWFDEHGFVSRTAVGETSMTWAFFDHAEINPDAIGLYPHDGDMCCCMASREQFQSDNDWQAATELVRRRIGVVF